jgi:ABC-type transporter Mla subunit MlaD
LLKRTLDEVGKDFKAAIKTIAAATKAAGDATGDLRKTASVIAKADQAVKALDRLPQQAGSLIVGIAG